MKREFRSLTNAVSTADGSKVSGYFAKFDSLSQDLGGFVEVLAKGCFSRSLQENKDILALADHDTSKVLARTTSGTLRVNEDAQGLAFDLDLPDTSYARDLQVLLSRGDIHQCSFGFRVYDGGDQWEMRNGQVTRTIVEAELFEGSIVASPAYLDTSANIRSMFPDSKGGMPAEITDQILALRGKQKAEEAAKAAQIESDRDAKIAELQGQLDELRGEKTETVGGIELTADVKEEKNLPVENVETREEAAQSAVTERDAADGDVNNPEKTEETRCLCDCQSCVDGDCAGCVDPDCDDAMCEQCCMRSARVDAETRAKAEEAAENEELLLRHQFIALQIAINSKV